MRSIIILTCAGCVGVFLGYVSNFVPFSVSWIIFLLWGVIGLLGGLLLNNKKEVFVAGIIYGLFVTAEFWSTGFQDYLGDMRRYLIFLLLISLVGAFWGYIIVRIGHIIRRKYLL